MIKAFQNFLESIVVRNEDNTYLLAISGGIDSMVMLKLFQNTELKFAVANINFKLRDDESDKDSRFVLDYCLENNIQIFQKEFDTASFSKEKKISTQMAARDLRYKWFEEIAIKNNFNYIAIAHHLDDQTETFLINLIRGTGISGMHGMAKQKAKIIRPLLFTTREKIDQFAKSNNIPFREDSSNASDKYQRNYIRHHILPHLYELRHNFSESLNQSLSYLKDMEEFADIHIKKEVDGLIKTTESGNKSINIKDLLKHSSHKLILYYSLKDFNFNNEHIVDILRLINNNESGKRIQSSSHQLIIERETLVLEELNGDNSTKTSLWLKNAEDPRWQENFIRTHFPFEGNYKLNDSNFAFIDFDKLQFPLEIRSWQEGDYFQPFGMKGKKKLSDFFIDQKFSTADKRNTLLLCSGKKIVWIIGHRIDDRFAINEKTNRIIKLEYYGNR